MLGGGFELLGFAVDVIEVSGHLLKLDAKCYNCSMLGVKGDLMGIPVRINEDIYNEAKSVAKAEFRSIPNQIEYWAKLGKCALDNPDLPIEFIKDLLASKNTSRNLSEPFEFEGGDD